MGLGVMGCDGCCDGSWWVWVFLMGLGLGVLYDGFGGC